MEYWTIPLILLLLVAIGIFIYLLVSQSSQNQKKDISKNLLPFSVTYNSFNPSDQSSKPKSVVNSSGNPQIRCPPGYKVNIVGAFSQVVDPYGECTGSASQALRSTCGDTTDQTSGVSCQSNSDCNGGMTCGGNGVCIPAVCTVSSSGVPSLTNANTGNIKMCPVQPGLTCSSDSDCGGNPMQCVQGQCQVNPILGTCTACSGVNGGNAANFPLCANLDSNYQNTVCSASGSSNCRFRDISAYLATECDGKTECNVTWDLSSPKYFGPLPCNLNMSSPDFPDLPIIPGWGGGTPSQGTKNSPANFTQGYYVHGIYTCVPDN